MQLFTSYVVVSIFMVEMFVLALWWRRTKNFTEFDVSQSARDALHVIIFSTFVFCILFCGALYALGLMFGRNEIPVAQTALVGFLALYPHRLIYDVTLTKLCSWREIAASARRRISVAAIIILIVQIAVSAMMAARDPETASYDSGYLLQAVAICLVVTPVVAYGVYFTSVRWASRVLAARSRP